MYPEPTDGRITLPKEPSPYTDQPSGRHVLYMVDDEEPSRLADKANAFLILILREKETIVIHTETNRDNIAPHEHEEDDDCPVCAAGKPKLPTLDQQRYDPTKASVDLAQSGQSIHFENGYYGVQNQF